MHSGQIKRAFWFVEYVVDANQALGQRIIVNNNLVQYQNHWIGSVVHFSVHHQIDDGRYVLSSTI